MSIELIGKNVKLELTVTSINPCHKLIMHYERDRTEGLFPAVGQDGEVSHYTFGRDLPNSDQKGYIMGLGELTHLVERGDVTIEEVISGGSRIKYHTEEERAEAKLARRAKRKETKKSQLAAMSEDELAELKEKKRVRRAARKAKKLAEAA